MSARANIYGPAGEPYPYPMVRRYIGGAVVRISYQDDGTYAGTITVLGPRTLGSPECYTWKFDSLRAPPIGHGSGVAYDSPKAFDRMAVSAVAFGGYYGTGNRGDECPEWAPDAEIADAISDAMAWAQDERGSYEVRRSQNGPARRVG